LGLKDYFYPESKLGGFTDVDGTIAFYLRVNALLNPSDTVVEAGCGRGADKNDPVGMRRALRTLKGKAGKVIGIDVDPAAEGNPFVDEFHLLGDGPWPFPDESVDLIVCDWVVEHLSKPEDFFTEVRRVLRNGGYFCARTTNGLGYVSLLARLIPNRLHPVVTSRIQRGREKQDVFPTFYRCNTVWKMRGMMRKHGLDPVVYGHSPEPGYLSFSGMAYALGVLYQRLAPGFLGDTLFAFGKKRPLPG
jgi:SAM-dependent methyltransferase